MNTTIKKQKQTDNAIYKIALALVLLCVGLVALRSLHKFYSTVGGQAVLDPMRGVIAIAGFVLFAASLAALALWKNPTARLVLPWVSFVFLMVGITGVSMLTEYTFGFALLYFLWAGVLVQYVIYQLYRWEFFFFSLPTITAGFLFYQLRDGFSGSMRNLLPLILTILSLICVVFVAYFGSQGKGTLVFGSTRVRLFSKRYNPFLHYLVAALWVICVVAAFLLGSLFAFYCMFAAIAVEFIAAVYYTFQLN